MMIQINAGEFVVSPAIEDFVNQELEVSLRLFQDQITRVEVHLRDLNGHKSGIDKRCLLEARLAGHQPFAVQHDADDLYDAIKLAAGKLERAVRHKIDRH
ncbi:MAG: HPF/RaiA family ribosome-associated protein [Phycisphaerales bacterium]|nr:HPF/RaiA family ribosome-associated protein [Phycisphaerales bacterium]